MRWRGEDSFYQNTKWGNLLLIKKSKNCSSSLYALWDYIRTTIFKIFQRNIFSWNIFTWNILPPGRRESARPVRVWASPQLGGHGVQGLEVAASRQAAGQDEHHRNCPHHHRHRHPGHHLHHLRVHLWLIWVELPIACQQWTRARQVWSQNESDIIKLLYSHLSSS